MTPLQSRIAALLLLFLVIAMSVAAIAVPWWLLHKRYDDALEDAVSKIERYSRIAGMREGLQQMAVEIKALEGRNHFLKSASPALAASELQEYVTRILEEHGGKLSSIQILSHKDEGEYRQVGVSLQLNAPIGAVKAILYALESARPYLFVDNLSIRAQSVGMPRGGEVADPELFVQFDVSGYALRSTQ